MGRQVLISVLPEDVEGMLGARYELERDKRVDIVLMTCPAMDAIRYNGVEL